MYPNFPPPFCARFTMIVATTSSRFRGSLGKVKTNTTCSAARDGELPQRCASTKTTQQSFDLYFSTICPLYAVVVLSATTKAISKTTLYTLSLLFKCDKVAVTSLGILHNATFHLDTACAGAGHECLVCICNNQTHYQPGW